MLFLLQPESYLHRHPETTNEAPADGIAPPIPRPISKMPSDTCLSPLNVGLAFTHSVLINHGSGKAPIAAFGERAPMEPLLLLENELAVGRGSIRP